MALTTRVFARVIGEQGNREFSGCNNIREQNDLILIEDRNPDGTSLVHAVIPKHALLIAWHSHPETLRKAAGNVVG